MRRRMYYALPGLESARKVMDDLLLALIEARHIHFLAKRGTPMDGLNECSVLQKTDVVHAAQLGFVLGALLGCCAGALLVSFVLKEDQWQIASVLGAALLGGVGGAWVSSMVGSSIPNSRLRQFDAMIDEGRILLMVDVPEHSVDDVRALVGRQHPEALDRGLDPHIPAFP
jgi:hypothetical protein